MDEHTAPVLAGGHGEADEATAKAERSQLMAALDATDDSAARSILLRRLGVLERWDEGAMEGSLRLLRMAVAEAETANRRDLVAEGLLSLAGSHYFAGNVDEAFAVLDHAESEAPVELLARIEFQRASMAALAGWYDTALAAYGRLVERFEAVGDDVFLANTLSNRGFVLLDRGDPDGARNDLERARAMFARFGDERQVAFTDHSLGRVAARTGDVLRALHCFHDSEQALRRLHIAPTDVQLNRCEVLLEAGLYAEAELTARETERALRDTGDNMNRSHALYLRCLALLGQSRLAEAASVAEQSAVVFRGLRRDVWEMRARVVQLLGSRSTVAEVERLASKLEEAGQWLAAAHAWTAVADRDPAAARAGLDRLPLPIERAPFEFRFAYLSVVAHEQVRAGDFVGALASTRAAMTLADRQRGLLGATDLRAAVSARLRSVAQLGLDLRRQRGRPWDVLRWVDRCRVASFRAAAPAPLGGPIADLLVTLRSLQLEIRAAESADMPRLLRRQADVQRELVAAQRLATTRHAQAPAVVPSKHPARLADATVVHHHNVADRVAAVVVRDGRATLLELGSRAAVETHRAHLSRLLRNLAAGSDSALDSIDRHARALCDLLLPDLGDMPCVVVPTADLLALPWSLLTSASPRPMTVAPNLAHWLEPSALAGRAPSSVGLVAGSDLTGAELEIDAVAAAWTGHPMLLSRPGRVAEALAVIEKSEIVHVACHGERSARDGRFAQLRLSDGSITGLELTQLPAVPRVMVFAACDAGLMDPLPGDEASGLAGLLFAAGVDTVIAPVGLLPDNRATTEFMVELHRHLASGASPSRAVHAAQMAAPAGRDRTLCSTINCYGRG
jgi:tetratricopeptide (TPR) repeat protein